MVRKMIRLCFAMVVSTLVLVAPMADLASAGPGSGAIAARDCVAGGGVVKDATCFGGRWDGAPIYT